MVFIVCVWWFKDALREFVANMSEGSVQIIRLLKEWLSEKLSRLRLLPRLNSDASTLRPQA